MGQQAAFASVRVHLISPCLALDRLTPCSIPWCSSRPLEPCVRSLSHTGQVLAAPPSEMWIRRVLSAAACIDPQPDTSAMDQPHYLLLDAGPQVRSTPQVNVIRSRESGRHTMAPVDRGKADVPSTPMVGFISPPVFDFTAQPLSVRGMRSSSKYSLMSTRPGRYIESPSACDKMWGNFFISRDVAFP